MKLLLYILAILPVCCNGFMSIFSAVSIASVATLYAGLRFQNCWFGNCCKNYHKERDFEYMKEDLTDLVYGQHIAVDMIVKHLKLHFLNPRPKKALVLSFHGTTGSGKNYVTAIAANHLMISGMKNQNVKLWSAKHHFYDSDKLEEYKEALKEEIWLRTRDCERSIFIFDEANELPTGLLDALKPMTEEYQELDGVDYRKTTFIFLSNTGAVKINEIVTNFKNNGKERTSLTLQDFQPLIQDGAFNEKGGFLKCRLIEKNMIDAYIPFLPLEKEQVQQCIKRYLKVRRCPIDENKVASVSELVNYEPAKYKYFSPYGCRGIDNLVQQQIDDDCLFNVPKGEL